MNKKDLFSFLFQKEMCIVRTTHEKSWRNDWLSPKKETKKLFKSIRESIERDLMSDGAKWEEKKARKRSSFSVNYKSLLFSFSGISTWKSFS